MFDGWGEQAQIVAADIEKLGSFYKLLAATPFLFTTALVSRLQNKSTSTN